MSTTHLDDERVQRTLHGELAPADAAAVRAHLAACEACAARLLEAEREESRVFGLLGQLDHATPRVRPSDVMRTTRPRNPWMRWAAGVLLAVGIAGVAYAAPGSPLPALLERLTGGAIAGTDARRAPAETVPATDGTEPGERGISVPAGARFAIVFEAGPSGGQAAVTTWNGPDVVVRASGGPAIFRADAERLVIEGRDASTRFEIELPRAAPRLEILVGSSRVLLKDGDRFVGPGGVVALPAVLELEPPR